MLSWRWVLITLDVFFLTELTIVDRREDSSDHEGWEEVLEQRPDNDA
jgi:hypothetical protein